MENLERQKTFNFQGEKVTVKFPNVGQMIDMESLKQSLTGNKYGAMSASGVKSMFYALDMVDAISFLQVCVPSVAKYYDIKNYTALAPEDIKELVEAYQKELKPWFDKVMAELKGIKLNDGGDKTEEGAEAGEEG